MRNHDVVERRELRNFLTWRTIMNLRCEPWEMGDPRMILSRRRRRRISSPTSKKPVGSHTAGRPRRVFVPPPEAWCSWSLLLVVGCCLKECHRRHLMMMMTFLVVLLVAGLWPSMGCPATRTGVVPGAAALHDSAYETHVLLVHRSRTSSGRLSSGGFRLDFRKIGGRWFLEGWRRASSQGLASSPSAPPVGSSRPPSFAGRRLVLTQKRKAGRFVLLCKDEAAAPLLPPRT